MFIFVCFTYSLTCTVASPVIGNNNYCYHSTDGQLFLPILLDCQIGQIVLSAWTGLPVEESIRMTGQTNGDSTSMVWPTLRWKTAKEQNRTASLFERKYWSPRI